jgi:hypothetical protein
LSGWYGKVERKEEGRRKKEEGRKKKVRNTNF